MIRKNKLLSILLITTSLVVISPTFFVVSCKKEKNNLNNLKDEVIYFNKYSTINENIKLIEDQLNKDNDNEKIKYSKDFYIKFTFSQNENKDRFIETLNVCAIVGSKKICGSVEAKQRLNLKKDILKDFNHIKFVGNDDSLDDLKNFLKKDVLEKINNLANPFFGNDIKLVEDEDLKIEIKKDKDNKNIASIYVLDNSKYIYSNEAIIIECFKTYNLDFFKDRIKVYRYQLDYKNIKPDLIVDELNRISQRPGYFTNDDLSFKEESNNLLTIKSNKESKKLMGEIKINIIDKANIIFSDEFINENYFLFTNDDLNNNKEKERIFNELEKEFIKNYKQSIIYKESKRDIVKGIDFEIKEETTSLDKNLLKHEKNISINSLDESCFLQKGISLIVRPYQKIDLNQLESKLKFLNDDNEKSIKNEIDRVVKEAWNINNNNYWANKQILGEDDYSIEIIKSSNPNENTKIIIKPKKESKYLNYSSDLTIIANNIFNLKRLNYVKISDNYFSDNVDKYQKIDLQNLIISKINGNDYSKMGQIGKDWDIEFNEESNQKEIDKNKIRSVKLKAIEREDAKVIGDYEVGKIKTKSISGLKGSVWQAYEESEVDKYVKSLFDRNDKFKDLKLVKDIDYTINYNIDENQKATKHIDIKAKLQSEKISESFMIDVTQKFDISNLQSFIDQGDILEIKEGSTEWQKNIIANFESLFKKGKDQKLIPEKLKWEDIELNKHYRIIGDSNDIKCGIKIESQNSYNGKENPFIQGKLTFNIIEKDDISKYYDHFKKIIDHEDFCESSTMNQIRTLFKEKFDEKFPNKKINLDDILVERVEEDCCCFFKVSISKDNKDFKGYIRLIYTKKIDINGMHSFDLKFYEDDDKFESYASHIINSQLNDYIKKYIPNVKIKEEVDYNLEFKTKNLMVIIRATDKSKWLKGVKTLNIKK